MNRWLVPAWALLACVCSLPALAEMPRAIGFRYDVEVGPLTGKEPVRVFVPLAQTDEHQRVLSRDLTASIPGVEAREDQHGNAFWQGELAHPEGKIIRVRVDYVVERVPHSKHGLWQVSRRDALSPEERRRLQPYLDSNELVPVNHPVLVPALEEIRGSAPAKDKVRSARAIYDWLIENMEYKKVGKGWGNGDAFWACSQRYGNCTDFHSLFNSLARSMGIPARFEIGFPIPEDSKQGEIGGYHCWSQFFLPEVGWVPIDASEAYKHPERREQFFGSQGADRIRFTTGRDLRLGASHTSGPLNYFIYPHVEQGGTVWKGPIQKTFSYRDVDLEDVASSQNPS